MIINRPGKASGKNKYWFNVKDSDGDLMKNIDFEKLKDEKI